MQTTLKTARLASMARMMAGNPTSPLALRALAMIDPERVSSAPGIVGLFERSAAQAHGDKDLSDSGKAARVRSAADSRLMGLSTTAKELVALEKEHRQKQGEAMRRAAPPAADAAQAVIDVALAQQIREAKPISFVLENSSERVRQALARVPVELSGITSEQQARIVGTFVSPEMAVVLGEEQAALNGAREVIQDAISGLQGIAQVEPMELVKRFGTDWKLPGVVDSTMQRLHAQNEASEAATE
ncbi:MAG: hypothetical protein JSS31_18910 [Proteobacteria bacterium]|nr:hypothetical protein [Pseudomonadota bacterium]